MAPIKSVLPAPGRTRPVCPLVIATPLYFSAKLLRVTLAAPPPVSVTVMLIVPLHVPALVRVYVPCTGVPYRKVPVPEVTPAVSMMAKWIGRPDHAMLFLEAEPLSA